jgi:hypothetical protein
VGAKARTQTKHQGHRALHKDLQLLGWRKRSCPGSALMGTDCAAIAVMPLGLSWFRHPPPGEVAVERLAG